MGKTLSLKLNDKELRKVDMVLKENDMTPSELLRKALWTYVNEVNQKVNLSQQEKEHEKVNQKVNLSQQEKHDKKVNLGVNQVNPIQIVDNHELIEYLKRNEEWLKDRIEHFENTQDNIFEKIDIKTKKEPLLSWVRM